jgi:hypothetical protein
MLYPSGIMGVAKQSLDIPIGSIVLNFSLSSFPLSNIKVLFSDACPVLKRHESVIIKEFEISPESRMALKKLTPSFSYFRVPM